MISKLTKEEIRIEVEVIFEEINKLSTSNIIN